MNKSCTLAAIFTFLLAIIPSYSEIVPTTGKSILLVNIQAVDTQTVESVRSFAEINLMVPVKSAELSVAQKNDTDILSLARSCECLMTTQHVCRVLLVSQPLTKESMIVAPDQNWAVINIAALKTTDKALRNGRIERQVMRCIATMFGVGYTPDPHAVNKYITSVEQLDQMGRNFDPPSLEQFHNQAIARGMEVLTFRRRKWLIKHGYIKDTSPTNEISVKQENTAPATNIIEEKTE